MQGLSGSRYTLYKQELQPWDLIGWLVVRGSAAFESIEVYNKPSSREREI